MARRTVILAALALLTPVGLAADWKKPYFGGTKPGSWAKYEEKASVGPNSTATVTRLSDEGGRVRIEQHTEFAGGQTPASTVVYEMAPGFLVDRDLIDFPKALVAMSFAPGNDKPAPAPAATIASVKKVMPQFGPTAIFKATEMVGGKTCDHYTYSLAADAAGRIETGDLWLSDAVAFGLVKKTSTTKNAAGKVLYTNEQVLVESGTKSLPSVTQAAPARATMTVQAAYEAGLVEITVEVDPKVKNGERLLLLVELKQGKPFMLTVPGVKTSLTAGVPLDALVFQPTRAQAFELTAATPAAIVVRQLGEHRVTEGKFQIAMNDGKPIFVGTAKTSWVK
jgi:hypothetical protein